MICCKTLKGIFSTAAVRDCGADREADCDSCDHDNSCHEIDSGWFSRCCALKPRSPVERQWTFKYHHGPPDSLPLWI